MEGYKRAGGPLVMGQQEKSKAFLLLLYHEKPNGRKGLGLQSIKIKRAQSALLILNFF